MRMRKPTLHVDRNNFYQIQSCPCEHMMLIAHALHSSQNRALSEQQQNPLVYTRFTTVIQQCKQSCRLNCKAEILIFLPPL